MLEMSKSATAPQDDPNPSTAKGVSAKERKHQEFMAMFVEERAQLEKWSSMSADSLEMWAYHSQIGGAEGIALKLGHLALDSDCDGKVTADEVEASEEQQLASVDQALNLLVNAGVVAALIFSVLYSTALQPLEACSAAVSFFGETNSNYIAHVFYALMLASLSCSILCIVMSTRMYLHLSVWMATVKLKTWFLTERSLVPLIVLSDTCLVLSVLALPFGTAVALGPVAGLMAIVLLLAGLILNRMVLNEMGLITKMHGTIREMLHR